MESLVNLFHGFQIALSGNNLLLCILGVSLGMVVGILPGIGPVAGTALLIPLTYDLNPTSAIIMLAGIYYSCMYAGTITSVLINVPGETASVITCIDGYQMAKNGRAGAALGVAAIGSFVGSMVTLILLVFAGPKIAEIALSFGPPEFFAVMMLGLLMLNALMGESLIKGLFSTFIGLFLATVGMDPITGTLRFTFNNIHLLEGIDFVILAMGLFGISEVFLSIDESGTYNSQEKISGFLPKKEERKSTIFAIIRGTLIGGALGMVPGSVPSISSIISYSLEKKLSKHPEKFGHGAIEGVAGPETANNAHAGSSLIPLFTMGIPSTAAVAVILGAFIMHGLTPGPQLFDTNPDFVWGIIASMFIGNIVLLIFNLPLAGTWAKIIQVPYNILYPLILIITMVGAYCINNSLYDVGMMLAFGALGYILKQLKVPLVPITLSFILGQQIETKLFQTLTISNNGLLVIFQRPISAVIMTIALSMLLISIISKAKKRFVKKQLN